MKNSRINLTMSSEAQLNRAFDYNHTLLAPLGTKSFIHDKPGARGTWDPKISNGRYIGGAP